MSKDIVIGLVIIVLALAAITGLTLWSRRTIERIAGSGFRSAREIFKDLEGGR